jgi:hypothetical protein
MSKKNQIYDYLVNIEQAVNTCAKNNVPADNADDYRYFGCKNLEEYLEFVDTSIQSYLALFDRGEEYPIKDKFAGVKSVQMLSHKQYQYIKSFIPSLKSKVTQNILINNKFFQDFTVILHNLCDVKPAVTYQ